MGIGAVNGALSMLELDDRVKVEYGKGPVLDMADVVDRSWK